MKKKVLFTLACAALFALGFVCQKQSSVNALINNNIEALTSDEGEGNVSFESLNALTKGFTEVTVGYDEYGRPIKVSSWEPIEEGWVRGPLIERGSWIDRLLSWHFGAGYMAGIKAMCAWGEGNKADGYCYEIVVRP